MSMSEQAIALIQQKAVEAAQADVLKCLGGRKLLVNANGVITPYAADPDEREHAVEGLEDLVRLAADKTLAPDPVIWHDENAVVLALNDAKQWGTARFTLAKLNVWRAVEGLQNGIVTQKDLLNRLRVALADAVVTPTGLIDLLRNVRFSVSQDAASSIKHDGSSFGKSIEMQASGAAELPEELTITSKVYRHGMPDGFTAKVRFALDVECESNKFRITAVGDDVSYAIDEAQGVLRATLETLAKQHGIENARIFRGRPS